MFYFVVNSEKKMPVTELRGKDPTIVSHSLFMAIINTQLIASY